MTRKRLPRSPFVSVTGVLDHQDIDAMLDKGAEFSLISANRLSEDSLNCLKGSSVATCNGVGGELVQVKGQICRDVQLTGMHLEVFQLRLLVVEGLVVPVILGVDFLSRLSKVTFDFHEMKLLVSGSGETVKLLEDYNDVGHKLETIHAQVQEFVSIPAGSEMFISCTARGMRQGQGNLGEPLRNRESMVKPAHSIVIPQSDKTLWIRVANANSQSEVLQKGEFVAALYLDVCVAYRGEKDGQ